MAWGESEIPAGCERGVGENGGEDVGVGDWVVEEAALDFIEDCEVSSCVHDDISPAAEAREMGEVQRELCNKLSTAVPPQGKASVLVVGSRGVCSVGVEEGLGLEFEPKCSSDKLLPILPVKAVPSAP